MVAIVEPIPDPSADDRMQEAAGGERDEQLSPPPNPLDPLLQSLAQLREFSLNYAEARKDQFGATVRRLVIIAAAAIAIAVMVLTMLAAAVVLLLNGIAEALATNWSEYPGIGKILIGGGLIATVSLAATIFAVLWIRSARKYTVTKYEHRHSTQRARFGRDVTQRAS